MEICVFLDTCIYSMLVSLGAAAGCWLLAMVLHVVNYGLTDGVFVWGHVRASVLCPVCPLHLLICHSVSSLWVYRHIHVCVRMQL